MYTDVAFICICMCVRIIFWFSRLSRGSRCVRHVSNENCFTFSKKLASNINFSEINLPVFLLPSPLPLHISSLFSWFFFFFSPIPVCRALKAAAKVKTRLIQATPLTACVCLCICTWACTFLFVNLFRYAFSWERQKANSVFKSNSLSSRVLSSAECQWNSMFVRSPVLSLSHCLSRPPAVFTANGLSGLVWNTNT